MELKVWVEGIQRIVCGVTETTTCQDVVFALAHATGKIGRFTLIERWRNNEKLLAPTDNPLKILMKWGEYSSDVQFILQRTDNINNTQEKLTHPQSQQQIARQQKLKKLKDDKTSEDPMIISSSSIDVQIRDSTKINHFNSYVETKEIGVVKGIPQSNSPKNLHQDKIHMQSTSIDSTEYKPEYAYVKKRQTNLNNNINLNNGDGNSIQINDGKFNSANVRNSLDKKINKSNENILEVFVQNRINSNNNNLESLKTPIGVSSNGALVPPPYRDPPPPRSSPLHYSNQTNTIQVLADINEPNNVLLNNAHYKDLIQLIKYQRDKITLQQADLTKFDTEIIFLENKEQDHLEQLNAITREINKADQMFRQSSAQLQSLQYIEEENEIVRQQEKTLKSEITLLRSKLANCETELLQCKNKIRLLLDEIQLEQVLNRQYDSRQQIERHFFTEVEKIQSEIDLAIQNADSTNKTSDNLRKEVGVIENAIAEKKKQVEQLVNEMKEVNLKSLAIAPAEEIKHLFDNSNRPGTQRRMIGSPRQLETAVPTSKNPHGVWV